MEFCKAESTVVNIIIINKASKAQCHSFCRPLYLLIFHDAYDSSVVHLNPGPFNHTTEILKKINKTNRILNHTMLNSIVQRVCQKCSDVEPVDQNDRSHTSFTSAGEVSM